MFCNNGKNNPAPLLFRCVQHLPCSLAEAVKLGGRNLNHRIAENFITNAFK